MMNCISHRLQPYRGMVNFILAQLYTGVNTWNVYDRGNHFPTQTAPDLLINDMRTFFEKLRRRREARP